MRRGVQFPYIRFDQARGTESVKFRLPNGTLGMLFTRDGFIVWASDGRVTWEARA